MSNPRLEVTGDGRPILHGRLTTRDAYGHDRSLDLSKILWNKDGRLSLNGGYLIQLETTCFSQNGCWRVKQRTWFARKTIEEGKRQGRKWLDSPFQLMSEVSIPTSLTVFAARKSASQPQTDGTVEAPGETLRIDGKARSYLLYISVSKSISWRRYGHSS